MIKDLEYFIKNKIFTEKYLLKKRLDRAVKNDYESELSYIDKFSDTSKFAIDVGVYRGVYSYKLSKLFSHVYSFEPNPLISSYLAKNLPKIINNVTIMNYALSDSNGDVDLKVPKRSKSIFKQNVEEIYRLGLATIHESNKMENFEKFKVKKKKLDDLDINKKKIGFIKIDVEGHEKEVIIGAEKLIAESKPTMLIEIENRHTQKPVIETVNYIRNLGFNCYFLKNNSLIGIEKLSMEDKNNNFIFTPE